MNSLSVFLAKLNASFQKLLRQSSLSLAILSLLFIVGCASNHRPREVLFNPIAFNDLKGWGDDDHLAALEIFRKSCSVILKKKPNQQISSLTNVGGKALEWQKVCKCAQKVKTRLEAKRFFEDCFKVYALLNSDRSDHGKITGYYEIELNGSRKKTKKYRYPVYKTPKDIKTLKGSAKFSHAAINQGSLQNKDLEIAWVDSKARLFFMHIQGSGVVRLENGSEIKLAYDNQNGYAYTAIGNVFPKYGVRSLHSATQMMDWLEENPKLGLTIMEKNESYVFFKEIKGASPIGAQGVPLTRERSIAIDSGLYPYGAPFWLETHLPHLNRKSKSPYTRLMIAQDTGGAIKGAVRSDIFFGRGQTAEQLASYMNARGRAYIFLPRAVKIPKRYFVKK